MNYFSTDDLEEAYIKLRSYIYHDNTDLYLRRQLVEFETGITKDRFLDSFTKVKYKKVKNKRIITVQDKLEYIAEELNSYHTRPDFWDELIEQVTINYYPKKLASEAPEQNFITNKKSQDAYYVEKLTPFINAPIELHIISVLWIIRHGVKLDAQLGDECLGNRLILNKEKSQLVKGSGLFRPYFNQYQHWRDKALDNAKQLLNDGRDVAFISLDIKEYFNSVHLPKTELYNSDESSHPALEGYHNLQRVFLALHDYYTELLLSKQKSSSSRTIPKSLKRDHVILPIGLVSSYILANYYLKQFDVNINRHIKPAYYGRYVDDLLFVVADPVHPDDLESDEFTPSDKISENHTRLEKFIVENFSPILAVDTIKATNSKISSEDKIIQIKGEKYKSLHCQSEKSLVYLFDAEESHLVIDKLKEELQERTSEFRDFPDEEESKGTFTDAAYHLQYEDSKEKVRTLKDYKEDRFGLTLFLANKIFSSLRQEEQLSDEACDSILKFFKNRTAIEFYRLWEKIFTLFLVNNKSWHYVAFYLQCVKEIQELKTNPNLKSRLKDLKKALSDYLDVANEITFSLNLSFYDKAFRAAREFDFKTEEWKADIFFSIHDYEPTKANVYWHKRFRRANMIRHHYIIHPLLNYTKAAKKASIKNLVNPHIDFTQFELDEQLLINSPRRLKFWECNMAQIFVQLGQESLKKNEEKPTEIFTLNKTIKEETINEKTDEEDFFQTQCLLEDTYLLFQKVNHIHIPRYEFDKGGSASRENIFTIDSIIKSNSPEVWLNEIRVKSEIKQDRFQIAFANTIVQEDNILSSIRGKANIRNERIRRLGNVIRAARKENADILLFPEFFIPIDLLSSIVDYARKNEKMVVTGLEHIMMDDYAFNFILTILPLTIGGVKDAIVVPRLKNHYAHIEQHTIEGNHKKVPRPLIYRYDLFTWKNLYFSPYYCFELANIHHRGLWKNKVDLVIGVEWNKDTPYYSNIVEATSRDLHCFFAQVNTSQYGDSRLTKPVESALKDVLRLKGGDNDALLVATLGTQALREFQRQTYSLTHIKKEFKPLPPDFDLQLVLKRINNESVLRE
ncbi:MAG: hypothetical protein WC756_01960 [Taibaiella sp.]|jgi:hypothetical protein